jgi:type IV secretory pathway ATPase VirB11/archaellum biosynthesis ATPase
MQPQRRLLSAEPTESERKTKLIKEFWTALFDEGDAGATTWEALDRLSERVTTALRQRPPNICLAESLTAEAALLIAGHRRS